MIDPKFNGKYENSESSQQQQQQHTGTEPKVTLSQCLFGPNIPNLYVITNTSKRFTAEAANIQIC